MLNTNDSRKRETLDTKANITSKRSWLVRFEAEGEKQTCQKLFIYQLVDRLSYFLSALGLHGTWAGMCVRTLKGTASSKARGDYKAEICGLLEKFICIPGRTRFPKMEYVALRSIKNYH